MATVNVSARPMALPVKVISTANLTLSGLQTVDSVAVKADDIVGVTGQVDGKNGAYLVRSGAWIAVDPGVGTGFQMYALFGTANANKAFGCDTTGAIIWGTTVVGFTQRPTGGAASPVLATTLSLSGTPVAAPANSVSLAYAPSFGTQLLAISDVAGNQVQVGTVGGSGTAAVRKWSCAFTLASNGTKDFSLGSLGGSAVIASADGSVVATVGLSTTYVATTGGQTYTNFSTTLTTASKVNVGTTGSAFRVENKTAGSLNLVIDFTLFAAG